MDVWESLVEIGACCFIGAASRLPSLSLFAWSKDPTQRHPRHPHSVPPTLTTTPSTQTALNKPSLIARASRKGKREAPPSKTAPADTVGDDDDVAALSAPPSSQELDFAAVPKVCCCYFYEFWLLWEVNARG